MTAPEPGDPAPDFRLRDQNGEKIGLDDLRGKRSLIVFIPYPFTRVCTGELCALRDERARLNELDANVVVVTCDTVAVNRKWAADNGFEFPVLSDFWPHGEMAQSYGAFNDTFGYANRYTFVLDDTGIVRDVISTDELRTARELDAYMEALANV